MKIYYSNVGSTKGLERYLGDTKVGILESYYGMSRVVVPPFCDWYFLDSGAFSAHRRGETIDPKDYGTFVLREKDKVRVYASLDVIGDAEGTWANQLILEQMGLAPLPCYHGGEPVEFLTRYVEMYDYIALGGVAQMGNNQEQLNRWLEHCWDVILAVGKGRTKVHGFGIQAERIMNKFPWYSVDASSCHVIARYGGIFTPWGSFKINPEVNAREKHWMEITPAKLTRVRQWVEQFCPDLDFEHARANSPEATVIRCAINVLYYEWIAKQHSPEYSNRRMRRLVF